MVNNVDARRTMDARCRKITIAQLKPSAMAKIEKEFT